MREALEKIRSELDTKKYSAILNLSHLENVFGGCLDTIRDGNKFGNPYSLGSARAVSWDTGSAWAVVDLQPVASPRNRGE